ncbi:MAG: hypothetical protein AB7P21_25905 [Lautropia sp.]
MNTRSTLLALAVSAAFAQVALAQGSQQGSQSSASGSSSQSQSMPQSQSTPQPKSTQQSQSTQQSKDQDRASSSGMQQQSATPAPAVVGSTLSMNGTVESIDTSDRSLKLKTKDGNSLTMHVGDTIRNFDKIKKGDEVAVRYTEAIAVALAKGGSDDIRKRVETMSSAQPEQGRPGMAATERTTVVANVFEIDKDAGKLTLRGPQGDPVEIRVNDKQSLQDIGKGDQVAISYVEASALAIQPGDDASSGKRSDAASADKTSDAKNASDERGEAGKSASGETDSSRGASDASGKSS